MNISAREGSRTLLPNLPFKWFSVVNICSAWITTLRKLQIKKKKTDLKIEKKAIVSRKIMSLFKYETIYL